jgi:hypothetical protein
MRRISDGPFRIHFSGAEFGVEIGVDGSRENVRR